jgi:hypothetical protein
MNQQQNDLNGQPQQPSRHFVQVCLLPLLTAAVWVGCSQPARVDTNVNPVGHYALVSVNGNKAPCTVQHEGHTLNVQSGAFIINADGTCSSKMVFSVTPGHEVNREVKATYTLQGSTLTMHWEGAGMTTGTVQDDTFTLNNEGMIFAYRK